MLNINILKNSKMRNLQVITYPQTYSVLLAIFRQ